jgi:hypothetical protein
MQCPTCNRSMVALFLTQRCDWCDFGPELWRMHRGFVVYADPDCALAECEQRSCSYVFRTVADATTWQAMSGARGTVRAVLSSRAYRWILNAATGIVLADSMCVVHPDHRYPDAVGEVFLAPTDKPLV